MTDHAARLVRHLHPQPGAVFDAWTDPSQLTRWYGPNPQMPLEFHGSVSPGGDYTLTMGGEYTARGTYSAVEGPHLLEFTWAWDHEPLAETVVRVQIDRTADGTTRLTLTHSGFDSADDAAGHQEGWDLALNRLVVLLGL